jgi:ATP-dependent DNA helicase DinG
VTAIGRNNYLCLRRMHMAEREQHMFEDPERHAQLRRIVKWSMDTQDGTRQGLPFAPLPEVWEEVQAEHGNCLQRACKHFDHCHWQRARRRMQTAQVLVVNHALYFADLALRIAGASYLPQHRVVIFDEAHHLDRVATESLGLRVGPRTISWHLRRLHGRRSEQSLLSRHGTPTARMLWEEVRMRDEAFFGALHEMLERSGSAGEGLPLHDTTVDDPLTPALRDLAAEIAAIAARTEQVDARMELNARANGLDALCNVLRSLCVFDPKAETPLVRWIERTRHGALLCGAPVDVSDTLRRHLFSNGPTAIMTSATLGPGTDSGFAWLRRQLGIDDADTLRVGSPFDYDRAVKLVLEEAMPDPGNPSEYRREVIARTLRHVLDNGGRALVLCTSWDFVRSLAADMREPLAEAGIPLLVQGEAPLAKLLDEKRRDPSSVLIGTDSLWEGIDVPGDALTLLVVTRLPFTNPSHPLTQARLAAVKARGGDAFAEHSLPEAVLKFRQGFGRLVRGSQDHGKVVVLDPRVRTKTYGKWFLQALPFSESGGETA